MLRSFLFMAAACLVTATAAAQQPATPANPATIAPDALSIRICDKIDDLKVTKENVAAVRDCQEAMRLQQERERIGVEMRRLTAEAESIELANKNSESNQEQQIFFSVLGPLIGGLIALLPVGLAWIIKGMFDARKSSNDTAIATSVRREQRIGYLLNDLADDIPAKQSFATAALIAMIFEDLAVPRGRKYYEERRREARTLVTALFARLRDKDRERLNDDEVKYIADELYTVFMPNGPDGKPGDLEVADFNLQSIRLKNCYWSKLPGEGVDLYGADLTDASFKGADLRKAALYGAKVDNTVFKGTDLRGANFTNATGIETAIFDKATKWSADTIWPAGFNPLARGLGPAG